MQPRLIRLRDAPAYLGMDKNRFNSEVRPSINGNTHWRAWYRL